MSDYIIYVTGKFIQTSSFRLDSRRESGKSVMVLGTHLPAGWWSGVENVFLGRKQGKTVGIQVNRIHVDAVVQKFCSLVYCYSLEFQFRKSEGLSTYKARSYEKTKDILSSIKCSIMFANVKLWQPPGELSSYAGYDDEVCRMLL